MNINEVIDILEERDIPDADIFIQPPDNGQFSDEDSGPEDEGGEIDNLTGRQLQAEAEISARTVPETIGLSPMNEDVHDPQPAIDVNLLKKYQWSKQIPTSPYLPVFPQGNYEAYRDFSPMQFFNLFVDDDLFDLLTIFSNTYAAQRGYQTAIRSKEMQVFVAILLLSGINQVPARRCYWMDSPLLRNNLVYSSIRRDRFEKIMQALHCADNNDLVPGDKYGKLRPLISHLQKRFGQHFIPTQHLSHDEAMIEYFGRHGCKQTIRNKPIRFGFKVWCLNADDGYLVTFDIYQGSTVSANPQYERVLGKSPSTVLNNLDMLPENKQKLPYSIYFDNLFTTFGLLAALNKRGYNATGTMRDNRLKGCPLTSIANAKKAERGASFTVADKGNGIVVCRWKDNAVVTISSTQYTEKPTHGAQRYSQKEKKHIEVQCPDAIHQYNKHMGGTDRQNQNVRSLRINIRGKKWWFCIFTWLIDVAVQNAWLLARRCGNNMPQLQFRHDIVRDILITHGVPPSGPGRALYFESSRVPDQIRLDGSNHLLGPTKDNKRRRCAGNNCTKHPSSECKKCNVGLCLNCSVKFHEP